jgi:hypothetical protein
MNLLMWQQFHVRLEGGRGLVAEENERKRLIMSELETSLLQEKISRRQKSRICWLKEGEKCTKFFHRISNSIRRFNSIESLSINGLLMALFRPMNLLLGTMLFISTSPCSQNFKIGSQGRTTLPLTL